MSFKTASALLAATAAVATTLGVATPASAGPMTGLYLGEHQGLGGNVWFFLGDTPNVRGAEDRASSVRNESGSAWILFEHKNYGGRAYCSPPYSWFNDLHVSWIGFGDKISSVKPMADCAGYPSL